MGIRGFGGIVQAKSLAFKQYTVVVGQHRSINEFQCALSVVLEVADFVVGIGIVALRLYLKAQLPGLTLCDFVTVGHHFYGERIGLLHIEVVIAG